MHLLSPPPAPCSPPSPISPHSPSYSPKDPFKRKIVGAYELGKTLGKGSYSTVKRAYHIETRNEVAVKILSPKNKSDLEDIDREIAILKLLKHPNIIQLLDVVHDETSKKIYLVFELVSGGDLFDYTIARGRLTEREARRIMREVVSGIAYCHAHMVVHRDLKLENLLMDKDGHARIADFGMSAIMQPGLRLNSYCGSPMYMSPEIVKGLGYGSGVDIWSLGVVLYTILVGQTPWKLSHTKTSVVEDLDVMLAGEYTIPNHVKLSPECEELISLMIVPDNAKRASIEQIMVHPWLAEGYDQPVTVPLNINPIHEVNEVVVRRMLAMGFTELQTRKAITEDFPSPARMVYQHMVQLMEEGCETPLIPASPRRRHSSISPRTVSPRSANTSPRSANTSPRRFLDGRARAGSDTKRMANVLRGSSESILPQFSSQLPPAPAPLATRPAALSASHTALPTAPPSPRTALLSSWRIAQMSTIKEEFPVGLSSENPGLASLRDPFNRNILPTLALKIEHHAPSAPCSPISPNLPLSPSFASSPSTPTSPQAASSNTSAASAQCTNPEEQLVVVRGAFNVATTTLKPRKVLIAEISRVLADASIAFTLSQSVFKCKVDPAQEDGVREKEEEETEKKTEHDEREKEKDVLKFEVEVCRVAGLEMLLGVRFHKVEGNKWGYQEICKKLMNSMKL